MKKVTFILTASYFLFACNDASKKEIQEAKKTTVDSMTMQTKIKETKQAVIDSMTIQANIEKTNQHTIIHRHHKSTKISRSPAYTSNSNNYTEEKSTTVVQSKKQKSKKIGTVAEGAIIGAGVGALSGAIISRNNQPGKGALIGGLIGAGVGAGTGVIINNKQKKKGNQK